MAANKASTEGWKDHGNQAGIDRHKANRERLCSECYSASMKNARSAAARARMADPAEVQDFLTRALQIMDDRDMSVDVLASALRVHRQTLAGLLSGEKTAYTPTITRALERLTELEKVQPGGVVPADKLEQLRDEYNRRVYSKWLQRRQHRLRVRGEPVPELVSS